MRALSTLEYGWHNRQRSKRGAAQEWPMSGITRFVGLDERRGLVIGLLCACVRLGRERKYPSYHLSYIRFGDPTMAFETTCQFNA